MIRLLVKKLLDDMNYNRDKKITDAINSLCNFFECTPAELIEYRPDSKPEEES